MRLRLSALYGALFLVSGAVMLAFTYLLVSHGLPYGRFYAGKVTTGPGPISLILNAPFSKGLAVAQPVQRAALPNASAVFAQLQSVSDAQRATSLHRLLLGSGIALAVMAVASSLLGWMMAGRALRPVQAMASAARNISERNLHARLPESGPKDELRSLASTFNALLARLESAFESQRRFVANASHELRTPLTLERTLVEVALADPAASAESLRATAERVLEIGAEQEALIEALITLARGQLGLDGRSPVDLAATTEAALDAVGARAAAESVTVVSHLGPAAVSGDPLLIERMVANLVDNAVSHNYPGGWVDVALTERDGAVTLRVSNTGPTTPTEDVSRLLQPFQRGGQERVGRAEGLGLGLSIVSAIAIAHGADLAVSARAEGGLDVVVSFPAPEVGPVSPGA